LEFEATTGKGKEKRKVLLSDQDLLWVRFRHEHFRIAADGISREVSELVKSSDLAKISIQAPTSAAKDPLELLRSIPEYQDQLSRLSIHLELSKKLIEVFEKIYLMEIARVEQELATGVDDEGREISCSKILQSIISLCNDARVGPDEKLRLVLLYLSQVEDVSEETGQDLVNKWAKLTGHHESAVSKFIQLGIHQASPLPDGVIGRQNNVVSLKSRLSLISTRGAKIKRNKTLAKESKFVHCRFKSDLTNVVEQILLNQLDNTLFPTVSGGTGTPALFTSSSSSPSPQPGPAAVSKAAMWGGQSAASEQENVNFGKEKLVVFVVGGVTLGECREIAKLESQYGVEIILGGSCILTPNRLLEILLL
jgi:syntaxin-binding protein 1